MSVYTKCLKLFYVVLLLVTNIHMAKANDGIYSNQLRFVRGFIGDITIPLEVAVQEATYQCGDSGITNCTCSSTTLSDGTGATDIYVDSLTISTACTITLTVKSSALSSSTLTTATVTNTLPTLTAALSKKIILTPDRSSVVAGAIKSWVCTTNIDGALNPIFKGMPAVTNGSSSILSRYNDEPYLGTCTYDSSIS